MKKKMVLTLLLLIAKSVLAIDLSGERLQRVLDSTYEVVVEKPTEDPVVYERELPLHLLPFQYRNDRYYSVGSAFRKEDGLFVTAAHVLRLGIASQNKNIFIRNRGGKVYKIDKVFKYSSNRDFVVFSVKDPEQGSGLPVGQGYGLNQKVYAAGNALGEGVVIRDGLYTSDTPEEVAGEWKWMRFSAAASPGNSGGPLLDQEGRVVGVILRKSDNENLNYALPIDEVTKFPDVAEFKSIALYKLDITGDSLEFNYNIRHDLPADFQAIDDLMHRDILDTTKKAASDFMAKYQSGMFPNGPGSQPLLYNRFTSFFPSILAKGKDGFWDMYNPGETQGADTDNGGRVDYGKMGNFFYIKMKRPHDVKPEDYYSDSKIFMDQVLKGVPYERQIGAENIRIRSIGKAGEDHIYADSYGRKWQVRSWQVAFEDKTFVTYSLPTPDGYAVIMSYSNTGAAEFQDIDLKILTNYLYYTYYGTIEQWQYFLSRKELLPGFADRITIQTDFQNFVRYEDPRFSFKVDAGDMKITKESDLQLRCSYEKVGDRVVWEPVGVGVGENKDTKDLVVVTRTRKPPADLAKEYRKLWDKITEKAHPYTGKAYPEDEMTNLSLVIESGSGGAPLKERNAVYVVTWHQQGSIQEADMESKVKLFASRLTVKEEE